MSATLLREAASRLRAEADRLDAEAERLDGGNADPLEALPPPGAPEFFKNGRRPHLSPFGRDAVRLLLRQMGDSAVARRVGISPAAVRSYRLDPGSDAGA